MHQRRRHDLPERPGISFAMSVQVPALPFVCARVRRGSANQGLGPTPEPGALLGRPRIWHRRLRREQLGLIWVGAAAPTVLRVRP